MQGPFLSEGHAQKVWRSRSGRTNVTPAQTPPRPAKQAGHSPETNERPAAPTQRSGVPAAQPAATTGSVSSPSVPEWIQAETDGARVVYAVRNGDGTGTVHYDCTRLDSVEPPAVFCKGDLPANLAAAERWVQVITAPRSNRARVSFKERLENARSGNARAAAPAPSPTGKPGGRGSPKNYSSEGFDAGPPKRPYCSVLCTA